MILNNSFFLETMHKIFSGTEKRLGIGFSGGPDSLCLTLLVLEFAKENLHLFEKSTQQFQIFLLCVNHEIRKETSIEIEFVKKFAAKNFLEVKIFNPEKNNLISSKTGNFHNHAHLWRYQAMLSFCLQNSISSFLSAHHKDDQIETFFMRLEKGLGLNALCGIRSEKIFHSKFENVSIFRPLLFVSKKEILKFLSLKNQIYVIDRSNENQKYTRSKIRKNLQNESFKTNEFKNHFDLLIKKIWNTSDALDFYIQKAFKEFVFSENCNKQQKKFQMDSAIFFHNPKEVLIQIFKKIFLELKTVPAMRIFYKDLESLFEYIFTILKKQDSQNFKNFEIYKSKIQFHSKDENNFSKIWIIFTAI